MFYPKYLCGNFPDPGQVVAGGWVEGRSDEWSTGGFEGSETILFGLYWWLHDIMHLVKLIQLYNTKSEP